MKLASFADLGSNGITDDTPVTAMDKTPVCAQCSKPNTANFAAVVWETLQFCNETCLSENQRRLSNCSSCKKPVNANSMGKYCVRFGSVVKQFCSNVCLEDHKKGLKVCCFCQKDISGGAGFLAPIGNKGQFKDFCDQACLKKYKVMHLGEKPDVENLECFVCNEKKDVEVELLREKETVKLCGRPCFSAYKFANTMDTQVCGQCKKDYEIKTDSKFVIYYDGKTSNFCSEACQNVFVMQNRKIVPCQWCKVKKYNFDMIEKWSDEKTHFIYCSLNCLKFHNATKSTWNGSSSSTPSSSTSSVTSTSTMPVIQSVSSLAGTGAIPSHPDRLPQTPIPPSQLTPVSVQVQTKTIREVVKETLVQPPEAKVMKNKGTLTKAFMQTKGVSCRPHPCHKDVQTDSVPKEPTMMPVPCPMYMPMPMQMYNAPYPVPIPVPVPVPVPVFIPTTRNSAKGILKQIKKIQAKLPADPFEAELLAMAGALTEAGDDPADDGSDDSIAGDVGDGTDALDDVVNKALQDAGISSEDLESDIRGGRVVPKALPPPDPTVTMPSPSSSSHSGSTSRTSGQKRRHSQASRNGKYILRSQVLVLVSFTDEN